MKPASSSSAANAVKFLLLLPLLGYLTFVVTDDGQHASTIGAADKSAPPPPLFELSSSDPLIAEGLPEGAAAYYQQLLYPKGQQPTDPPQVEGETAEESTQEATEESTQEATEESTQEASEETERREALRQRRGGEGGERRGRGGGRFRRGRGGEGEGEAGVQEAAEGETSSEGGPGGRAERRGRWPGNQEGTGPDEESSEERSESRREPRPREGIAVEHPLIRERCVACHAIDDDGKMSRISYMRKTPEGWEISLKRMIRLYSVALEPEEAKEVVRYLSDEHGLSRSEARVAMYESERRVHWSEQDSDSDLRETCADCHTLGRVFSEWRDGQEWKYLKATHLALYPLVGSQSFRGRSRGRGGSEGGGGFGGGSSFGGGGGGFSRDGGGGGGEPSSSTSDGEGSPRSQQRGEDRADRVLSALAKTQPLFTDEWRTWRLERREVPLDGEWLLKGHEIGRRDIRGTLELTRVAENEYQSKWTWHRANGRTVVRSGTGIFYAGHSWRGRSSSTAPGEFESLREVLLLDESWIHMTGRLFTGEYNELGIDVELLRIGDSPGILGAFGGEIAVPSEGNEVEILGCGFKDGLDASDFHLGQGLTVTAARRHDDTRVTLTVNAAADAKLGTRAIDYGIHHGPRAITLYDTIDSIQIRPNPGLARNGGKMRDKQMERFEAVAMSRGPDGIPYNDDDVELMTVPVSWHLEEFAIRPNDDDLQFVGSLDEQSGVFTPAIDGPNPERRWNANNIGDVYVVATCTLTVPERREKKEKKKEKDSDGTDDEDAGDEDGQDAGDEDEQEPEVDEGPPVLVQKEFRARGHLLVMVPIYVRWDLYEWNQR